MARIFICYRREDSQFITDRVFDHLARHFSRRDLFKDVDNIPLGADFRTNIENAIRQSTIVLPVIGPSWLSAKNSAGQRRIDNPDDSVHIEISSALKLKRTIIPLLAGGAQMPTRDQLPQALQTLAYLNALHVRSDPDFASDIQKLTRALRGVDGHWYRGWFARASVATIAVALGGVVLWYWYWYSPVPRPVQPGPTSIGSIAATRSDTPPPAPSTAQGCVDVPFTDATKFPSVTTIKRICN